MKNISEERLPECGSGCGAIGHSISCCERRGHEVVKPWKPDGGVSVEIGGATSIVHEASR